eukprot:TRINITY_DN3982_c0_g1_i2.p1 TRINITY_DN3982_c0_g1~~TRINITY_DN3982_c0_g1_i2.p1  ORF type:complete len:432 (+),score=77.37 TRINITY_DN3982_c0_g1_i2:343-1638(+)
MFNSPRMDCSGADSDESEDGMFSLTELNISDLRTSDDAKDPATEAATHREVLKRSRRRREEADASASEGEKRHCTDNADLKLCARMNIPMLRSPGLLRSPSPSLSDCRSSSAISGQVVQSLWIDDSSSENCGPQKRKLEDNQGCSPDSHKPAAVPTEPATPGEDGTSEAEPSEVLAANTTIFLGIAGGFTMGKRKASDFEFESTLGREGPREPWCSAEAVGEERLTEEVMSGRLFMDSSELPPAANTTQEEVCVESSAWRCKNVTLNLDSVIRDHLDSLKGPEELVLHEAIKWGFFALADHLVDAGCPLLELDLDGHTALQLACESGCVWLVQKMAVAALFSGESNGMLDKLVGFQMLDTRGQICRNDRVDRALQMLNRLPRWTMGLHHVFPYEFRRTISAMVTRVLWAGTMSDVGIVCQLQDRKHPCCSS